MRIRTETDMGYQAYFKDLKCGTVFEFLDSPVLFMKIDVENSILDVEHGRVFSLGTYEEFLRVFPRYDAAVIFRNPQ